MTAQQLALFEVASNERCSSMALTNGVATKAEAGLAKEIPPGAERLLAALVKHGLDEDSLVRAAALVLALEDEGTNGTP